MVFLRVTEAGHLELKDNHQYFYQVQLQMKLCNASYCDFVVWGKNQGILVQRLFPDAEFINRALQQVENFVKRGILPELVGNWYTKSRVPSKVLSVYVPSSSAATVSSSAMSVCVPSSSAATVSSSAMSVCVPSSSAATVSSCSAVSVCVPSSSAATVSSCSAVSVCVPFSSAATVSSCSTISVQSSSESLLSQSTVPSHKRSVSNFCSEKTWCYCGQDESYDKIIACEHPDCEVEWFHYSCIGLTKELVSDGDWFCPDCQTSTQSIKRCKQRKM